MQPPAVPSPTSFRDPAGFVFHEGGLFKRAISHVGLNDYEQMMSSGLYEQLTDQELLLSHHEDSARGELQQGVAKVIVPEQLKFISYPYEWCFDQLKDAALLTLEIQRRALNIGMALKDASFFNVQFHRGKPVFIDTLSFEIDTDRPWVAYRQFCEHFLSPLLLAAHVDSGFHRYLATSIDGFDLSVTHRLLPLRVRLQPGVFMHVGLHARSQQKHAQADQGRAPTSIRMSSQRKIAVIESLISTVQKIHPRQKKSSWSTYYADASHYSDESEAFKKQAVEKAVRDCGPKLVFDLGGNVGNYSRVVTGLGIDCVCYDQDPLSVNENYVRSRDNGDSHMLPLVMDLTNPTPPLGFGGKERMGLLDRPGPDLVLALAVVHHLRITGNVPLSLLVDFLARLSGRVLIEFVPKEDPLVQGLLAAREDIFDDYEEAAFEEAFQAHFQMAWRSPIPGTKRTLYLFERR